MSAKQSAKLSQWREGRSWNAVQTERLNLRGQGRQGRKVAESMDADKVGAVFAQGFLIVRLPKTEQGDTKPAEQNISIKADSGT